MKRRISLWITSNDRFDHQEVSLLGCQAVSLVPYPLLMRWPLLNRRVHYWVGLAIAAPVLVVLTSGLLLQLKKQWAWIQPPEQRGTGAAPRLGLPDLLAVSHTVPAAGVRTWADIYRVDVRPDRGLAKVITKTRWEIQVDTETGRVLQVARRRSDLLESIHDGSWFHPHAKLWLFLPSGVLLLVLWVTGLYLAWLPFGVRARRRAGALGRGLDSSEPTAHSDEGLRRNAQAVRGCSPTGLPHRHGSPLARAPQSSTLWTLR